MEMDALPSTSEIVEATEELDFDLKIDEKAGKHSVPKSGNRYSIEDDINRLFEAIDVRTSGIEGLCISQASEMAAMKRLSRPSGSSGASEAGTIKRLYRTVVVDANGSGLPLSECSGNLVEISLVPERITSASTEKMCESPQMEKEELSYENAHSSLDQVVPLQTGCSSEIPRTEVERLKSSDFSSVSHATEKLPDADEKTSASFLASVKTSLPEQKNHLHTSLTSELPPCNRNKSILTKVDERSRSREKGEFSQSSKSSIGDYSSSTSVSEDSNLSGSSRCGNRPHMAKDLRWEAIRHFQRQHGSLGLKHFKLIKKLGCGDIGSVYLAELTGTNCLFALKVMDNEFLASRKKMSRAETEREILQMLDHPFLPTLFAHFVSDRFSCLVMEYCPGGDLHVLRQKQPSRSFSEQAARFYVAEVLLALEYLHMLGVVYRDLKPENILVREDGHIMLSDFDLSLRCTVNPIVVQSSSPVAEPTKKMSSPCSEASCIDPFCLHPAWQVSCFTPRLLSVAAKSRKLKSDLAAQVNPLPQLVVEPTNARSNSFVGTHEYLAPEIIKGEGHGSAVDWWTFGIFLFELLYGRTPFKGSAKGAAEIKQHPFFEGLNWALIRCAIPPEMPKFGDSGIGASATFPQNKESTKCKESKGTEEYTEFEMF
ncbi:hypothetical protein GH714_015760 [Hevea brasiliensis]|uniref:non-specific serine/threonine protein kinase n=1 Tax=Hevea brasiliensis TaxID=3981 RepID=A0A6A6LIH2_HEVBR|nr:hypothetical protein GH714_015760 [Hevea brasiliensis]